VNTIGSFNCNCFNGYNKVDKNEVCLDINECDAVPCNINAQCINIPGSFSCECLPGYESGKVDSDNCVDINECLTGSQVCHENSVCTNTEGSFTCKCEIGFAGNGYDCEDVDECSNGINTCQVNSECENTIGSFTCLCEIGYEKNDDNECVDVDECSSSQNNCDQNATCKNTIGSFECKCYDGFSGDQVCEDIDECSNGSHNCLSHELCVNTFGSFKCKNVRHRLSDCPQNLQISGSDVPQFYLGLFQRERKFFNGMATYRKRNLRMLYSHGRWRVIDKQGRSLLRSAFLVRHLTLNEDTEPTDLNIDDHELNFDGRAINGFICPSDLSKGWEILKLGSGWFASDVKIKTSYAQKTLESNIFNRCQNELLAGQESLNKLLVNQLISMLKKFKRKNSTKGNEYSTLYNEQSRGTLFKRCFIDPTMHFMPGKQMENRRNQFLNRALKTFQSLCSFHSKFCNEF